MNSNLQGDNLSRVIKSLGIKKNRFAEDIRLSQSLISEICNGKKPIQEYQLLLFEKVHGVNPDYIRGTSNEMFITGSREKWVSSSSEPNNQSISEKSDQFRKMEKQIENLEADKQDLRAVVTGLREDKQRLLDELVALKRDLSALEKGKNSA
jgi:chromosome segregation ATPase